MRSETGRERYYRQVREIRDELGIPHETARVRWSEFYAPGGAPIKPVRRIQLAIRASTTNQRTCPFCRDSIFHPDEGGPDFVCNKCQAHYHLDCFEEELGGRCATLGCSTRRVINRARVRIQARGRTQDVTPEVPTAWARGPGETPQDLTTTETQNLLGRLEEQRRELVAEDRRWALGDAERAQTARERLQEVEREIHETERREAIAEGLGTPTWWGERVANFIEDHWVYLLVFFTLLVLAIALSFVTAGAAG